MYLSNKYTKWYYNIIERAQSRVLPNEVYTEKHHIIPRSLGGCDDLDNIAILTAREHWICHLLLTKMTTGRSRYKMAYALNMMSNIQNIGEGRYMPPSKLYEYGRKLFHEATKHLPKKGRKLTEEQIEKRRGRIPWNKGKKGLQKAWNKGKSMGPRPPMKEETKEKLRQCHVGKPRPPEVVEKMKKSMKGRMPWNKGKRGLQKAWNRNPCIFISPNEERFEFESQRAGCQKLGLPERFISEIMSGKRTNYKGWRVEKQNPKENK